MQQNHRFVYMKMCKIERVGIRCNFIVSLFLIVSNINLFCDIGIRVSYSYESYNIGMAPPSFQIEIPTVTVYNLGNAYCQLLAKVLNSENWTAVQTTPGYDQFSVELKGGDITSYTYLSTTTYQVVKQWFKDGTDQQVNIRYSNPSDSSTSSTQTIRVIFHAGVEAGYTYNAAGDFYWRDAGPTDIPPSSDWSDEYSSILPSSLWVYMTGTTAGWMSYNEGTTVIRGYGVAISVNNTTCTQTITNICPLCGIPMLRYYTSDTSASAGIQYGYNHADTITVYKPGTAIFAPTTTTDPVTTTLITPPLTLTWGNTSSFFSKVNLSDTMTICPVCSIIDFNLGYTTKSSGSYTRGGSVSYSRIVILD